jgi:hypothetical protein
MQTAALHLDFTSPSVVAAKAVAAIISAQGTIDRPGLLGAMGAAHGASSADGIWSIRVRCIMFDGSVTCGMLICQTGCGLRDCASVSSSAWIAMKTRTGFDLI